MNENQAEAMIRFAETVSSSHAALGNVLLDSLRRVDAELQAIRGELADMDMAKASRRQLEELHSRVDRLEETWTKS